MESPLVAGSVLIGIGLLTLLGAIFNWAFMMRSGRFLNALVGDAVARVIYALAGIVFIVLGFSEILGLNWI